MLSHESNTSNILHIKCFQLSTIRIETSRVFLKVVFEWKEEQKPVKVWIGSNLDWGEKGYFFFLRVWNTLWILNNSKAWEREDRSEWACTPIPWSNISVCIIFCMYVPMYVVCGLCLQRLNSTEYENRTLIQIFSDFNMW